MPQVFGLVLRAQTCCVVRCMLRYSNSAGDKSLVIKWRRVEGQAQYSPSIDLCANDPWKFLGYPKRYLERSLGIICMT